MRWNIREVNKVTVNRRLVWYNNKNELKFIIWYINIFGKKLKSLETIVHFSHLFNMS